MILVFYGDFYNQTELNEALGNNYLFSKIEIIYNLYMKHGENFAEKLNGQFSIIIFNKLSQHVIVVNDRFARIPTFYKILPKEIVIASEKKGIINVLGHKVDIDYLGLLQVFSLGHNIRCRTFIKDIFTLPPGSILSKKNSKVHIKKYYNWEYISNLSENSDERVVENLYWALGNAVHNRVSDKERVAIWLSGGLDSRSIACSIKPENRSKIHAHTFGENYSKEFRITKKLSNALNFQYSEHRVDPKFSLITQLGAWKSEFAVSGHRPPFYVCA